MLARTRARKRARAEMNMTHTDLATRDQVIATVRNLHLSLADKCRAEVGVHDEDIAIAATFSALEASTVFAKGDKAAGIAWLRDALDLIEAGQPLTAETIQ
jgi:hypothetical protein